MFSWRTFFRLIGCPAAGWAWAIDSQAGGEAGSRQSGEEEGRRETALFAGGCFWCMETPFARLGGVVAVESGYGGGNTANPSYENYAAGGHIEVVRVVYDPDLVSYRQLLATFWRQIDPTDAGGQFVDRGHAYTSAIFYYSEEQRLQAEASK